MSRRLIAFIAVLLLAFPLLAACGNDGPATTQDNDTEAPGVATAPITDEEAVGVIPTVTPMGEATTGVTTDVTAAATSAATAGATAAITAEATGATTGAATGSGDKNITIGSKNFTEQFILGELYAQALEAKGYTVNRKLNLGSEQIADRALRNGQIDMYPEYTGTALGAILKIEDNPKTPEETYNVVKEGYAKRNPSVTLLEPADFNNTYGIVVRREIAEQYNLKTLDDLAKASSNLRFASFSEFQDRADGFPNIKKNYPEMNFKDIVLVNSLGLRYAALDEGDADVGVGFRTDGQIASQDLAVMEDPKNIWPFYYPAPAVRTEYLETHPEVEGILNSVSEKLDLETMQELNAQVDIEKEEPADVASAFLEEQGMK